MSATDVLVEAFVQKWLKGTKAGGAYIERYGLDGATDAIFELLNTGFLKIRADGDALIDLVPVSPAVRPTSQLRRSAK